MPSVTYARVSSREQEETGYSLPAQEKLALDYAARKNLENVKVFSVAESASGAKQRKVFAEMIAYLERNKVKHLVCEKVDRITRNLKEALVIHEWLEADSERTIHFVKQNLVITKNSKSDEKFRWDIEIVLAKKYVANLSEEVKKGQAEKLAQGWLPTKPPLGYKTIGEKGKKIHVPDENIAPHVREMFGLYATGNYSVRELGKLMSQKLHRKIWKSRLAVLLSDTFYYGQLCWNEQLYQGNHEPLITKALFDEVQRVLHRPSNPKYSKHLRTFQGFVKCAECGGTITWEQQKGIVYGHCNKYRDCTKRPFYKEKDVIGKISDALGLLVLKTKGMAEWLTHALKESYASETDFKKKNITNLQRRAAQIDSRLDKMYDDRLDGRISAETYDKKAREYEQERKALQSEVLRHQEAGDETRELRVKIFELSQAAPNIFAKAAIEKQRTLIGLVFERLEMKGGKLSYSFREPFAVLAKNAQGVNKHGSKVAGLVKSPIDIFELEKNGYTKRQKDSFESLRPDLLRG